MSESKYLTIQEKMGRTCISEDVVAAIAVGALRDVEGVSGVMSSSGPAMSGILGAKEAQRKTKGVRLDMSGTDLKLDLYITVRYGHPIPEVAENAQNAVASAVEAMTGCQVGTVNIHVGGVTVDSVEKK